MTTRAIAYGGRTPRALSQSDAIPKEDIDEITDRIELLAAQRAGESKPISDSEIGDLLSSFESQLLELNKSLRKESRTSRTTVRNFVEECAKTKESVAELNTELELVVRRSVG